MRTVSRFFFLIMCFSLSVTGVCAQCSWAALPASINFGTYSVFGGASNTTTTSGSVRCTGAFAFQVTATTGSSGSYAARKMSGTATYNVFTDAARTMIWGDGSAGTAIYAFFNLGGTNTFSGSAYGTVPGGQDLAPGSYADTFTAILSYRPLFGGPWTNLPGVAVPVRMTVLAECRADTFSLSFGNYSPLSGAAVNASSAVKIYCTKNTTATFALDNGANPSGVQKRMTLGGASFLNYTGSLAAASGTSTSVLTPIGGGITLNGSIPASQDIPIGSYIDTLQVVVNY